MPASHEKFGTVLGVAEGGVEVYSCNYKAVNKADYPDRESYRHFIDGEYMGYKWQCVELARRWLYINRGYVFDDVPMAYDIFRLQTVRRVSDGARLPLRSYKNGAKRKPEVGSLIIWKEGGEFHVTGHVAVVTHVEEDHICFIEQNVENTIWPEGQNYSRTLHVSKTKDDGYWLECSIDDATILGWVIQTDDNEHCETFKEPDAKLFNLHAAQAPNECPKTADWLDTKDPAVKAYVQMMGGAKMVCSDANARTYYRLSQTCEDELKRATNELHAMITHATYAVLHDDNLLRKFNLPEILWPKIRQSWNNRQNQIITGRMDFAVSEAGIKLYEYNADSASCHMETGFVQNEWANAYGCFDGESSGQYLRKYLISSWKESSIEGDLIHIMCDEDQEETYHALWMKSLIEDAGFKTSLIQGSKGLSLNADKQVIDAQGQEVKWVWKTWAWETALDQVRAQLEEAGRFKVGRDADNLCLADVLLHDDVMVFEPLWTLIPSNKAILPILWTIYPDHPYLLKSSFELDEDMLANGYVSKPIVGRCGENISLYDENNSLIRETLGQFDDRDQMYQELWKLPQIEDKKVQVGTFCAGGQYAGSCIRADKSPIITSKSDVYPLRIVTD